MEAKLTLKLISIACRDSVPAAIPYNGKVMPDGNISDSQCKCRPYRVLPPDRPQYSTGPSTQSQLFPITDVTSASHVRRFRVDRHSRLRQRQSSVWAAL